MRSFLGLACYYRRFIKGFSQLVLSLTTLTRKNNHFEWNLTCEVSFQELKNKFTSTAVLIIPDSKQNFGVYIDTSKNGLGCILM